MDEPKFKIGQTVKVLSRLTNRVNDWENIHNDWENIHVNNEAIIKSFSAEGGIGRFHQYKRYSLWLLHDDARLNRSCSWFEEIYLELVCSNEKRGLKILKEQDNG